LRLETRRSRNLACLVLGGVYLAGIAAAAVVPAGVLPLLGGALVAVLELLRRRGLADRLALLAAWAPLHFLVVATGSLTSPLLPLIAAWLVVVALVQRSFFGWALLGALAALLLEAFTLQPQLAPADVVRTLVLLALPVFVLPLLPARPTDRGALTRPARQELPPAAEWSEPDPELVGRALELVRCASGAAEAVLWDRSFEAEAVHPIGRAAEAGRDAPEPVVQLAGHPYAWVIDEHVPVHLERGRKPLPREWAAEMLLVPVQHGHALLALAFPGVVPPGAEGAALGGARVLADLRVLLGSHADAARAGARLRALTAAVHALPAELRAERFASILGRTLADLTGAQGAAIALWQGESGLGRVLAVEGNLLKLTSEASEFRGAESRLAMACKHATALEYADLVLEPQKIPLCTPGEKWDAPVRAAVIQPIQLEGRVLGAALLWHADPFRFEGKELESLELVCSVAAPALQSVLHFEVLDRRAAVDPLTGLPNRGAFDARFASVCAHFQRYGRPFGVVVLDIDHFKKFNDSWGHEAGDRVLQHVAVLLRKSLREVDLAARLGGEEFVVLLPETSLEQALAVAERIRRSLESTPLPWNGRNLAVTASLGVATCPDSCLVATESIAEADAALYRSKEDGRNRVSAATPRH
jgi:diguanylate cyclase (GGDEF)-like protein